MPHIPIEIPHDTFDPENNDADCFRLQLELVKNTENSLHLHYDKFSEEWSCWMHLGIPPPTTGKGKTLNEAVRNLAVAIGKEMKE